MATSPRFVTMVVASIAFFGSACSGSDSSSDGSVATPAAPSDGFVVGPDGNGGLLASTDDTVGSPQPDTLPGPGEWVVRSVKPTLGVWADPGPSASIRFAVETTNPWDQAIAYPVLHARQTNDGEVWYRILLGIEPNGSNGWVRASEVDLAEATDRIVVDTSTRTLREFRDGELVHRFLVGIGRPDSPTTPGRFFVWARLQPSDPSGSYGSYLLGLSGFSEVHTDWPGGGRMAIHGTADPTDRGQQVSFGCVRVFNEQMDQLRDVPMGTTVTIKP